MIGFGLVVVEVGVGKRGVLGRFYGMMMMMQG